LSFQSKNAQNSGSDNAKWFPKYDFDALQFKSPANEFSPFARWWWPRNDVTEGIYFIDLGKVCNTEDISGGANVKLKNILMNPDVRKALMI
jgi:hypothetical protein